jgi:hydrogenase small subunit
MKLSDSKKRSETYYESIIRKGYSRRDFMKFVSFIGAYMGVEASGLGQIAKALETKKRLSVIWLHFQECTGCTESFIRSDHPIAADIILDNISLDYTETLMAASGHKAEAAKKTAMEENYGEYILCVEGAIPVKDDGVYCTIGGRTAVEILKEAAAGAKAIITFGSCSSYGGVQAAAPNPTGSVPVSDIIKNKPIIKVPGCPPIGEVMAGVIVHVIAFGKIPALDGQGRPEAFYSKRVHDSCYRRPYFDAGLFAKDFDDANAKRGYCLYKLGCRGPVTYNACGITKWNNGVSYPIQSGHPCLACSEKDFWDNGPFYERITNIPGFGLESTADDIGKVAVGAALGAAALHAVSANLVGRKEYKDIVKEGEENTKDI